MSSDATFEPEVDVNAPPPASLTATQSLARVFMAEGNGRYTVILPDSSAALALKSGATDGSERTKEKETAKPSKPTRGGKGGKTRGGRAGPTGMARAGCGGVGRCNGSCLDRGGKTCNGRPAAAGAATTDEKADKEVDDNAPKTGKKNRVLVDLHSAFHNTVRVARHSVVLVDLAKAPDSLKKGSRVVGTIINVVRDTDEWSKAEYWPYPPPVVAKPKIDDMMPPSDDESE